MGRQMLVAPPENQVKFHENPFNVSPVFPCGQVDRRTDKHSENNVGSCRKRSKNMCSCLHILRQLHDFTDLKDLFTAGPPPSPILLFLSM
jgi:hypothetical protein